MLHVSKKALSRSTISVFSKIIKLPRFSPLISLLQHPDFHQQEQKLVVSAYYKPTYILKIKTIKFVNVPFRMKISL